MMPSSPPPRLVVRKPRFLFRILEHPLYPVTLSLQESESPNRRIGRCVAQRVLDPAALTMRFAADHQVPAVGSLVSLSEEPDTLMEDLHLDRSLGALSCLNASPPLRWLLSSPLIGPNALSSGVPDRILQIDSLVPMNVGHESQFRVVQSA